MSTYEQSLIELVNSAQRAQKAQPLILGAVASAGGGVGGPPGGFIGYLPESRVAYDTLEAATSGTGEKPSLVDNLNHIRYRIGMVESGTVVTAFTSLTDTPDSYTGQAGKAVVVKSDESGLEFGNSPEGITSIVAGSGIVVTEVSEGVIQVSATYSGGGAAGGVTQIVAGSGITISPVTGSGVVTITSTASLPETYYGYTEDLSSQLSSPSSHFTVTYPITAGTLKVYINGVRQVESFVSSIDVDFLGFTLAETIESSSVIVVDYGSELPTSTVESFADLPVITYSGTSKLTNSIIIPGLQDDADVKGRSGSFKAEEFDSDTGQITWYDLTPTNNINSTIKSGLYASSSSTTESLGLTTLSGVDSCEVACKISLGIHNVAVGGSVGLLLCNTDRTNRVKISLEHTGSGTSLSIKGYSYASSTYTQRGSTISTTSNELYFRVFKDDGGVFWVYWSVNGLTWVHLVSISQVSFSVTKIGYSVVGGGATGATTLVSDWLRVISND